MFLKSLLLKIETGQVLSERQEKSLAVKLMLAPSILRTLLHILLALSCVSLILIGILGGFKYFPSVVSYILAGVVALFFIYVLIFPKRRRINNYLKAVDKFYQVKFEGLDYFDLFYTGQHRNPHILSLKASKIYFLTDGYYYLFFDDYFKDTKYPLPSYLTTPKNTVYLRVIDEQKLGQQKVLIKLEDIESFYLTDQNIPVVKLPNNPKYHSYYNYFLDQNPRMTETCMVVLTMKSKAVFRLSYEIYEAFLEHMPHKEKK